MTDEHQVEPFGIRRRAIVDSMRVARQHTNVHGLVAFDVTEARERIDAHEAETGEQLSFTAFVVYCLARAVAEHPRVHAYRDWRGRLVVFDDVDVTVLVETDIDGELIGLPHVVRRANRRPVESIHQEIRRAQARPDARMRSPLVPLLLRLPGPVRRLFFQLSRRLPHQWKRLAGTVAVTSVGMFGEGAGWAITPSTFTCQLTVGGIEERPTFVDGEVVPREYLSLTLTADHDVVDGAPLARFAQRLKELIESADGLPAAEGIRA